MDPDHRPPDRSPRVEANRDGDRPFSTSGSLAHGLVSRLVREWNENDARYWESKRRPIGAPATSKLPMKRAMGYRVLRERSYALIPPGHHIIAETHGDQNGLDKRAGFGVVHWSVMSELRRLEVLVTYGRPGWQLPLRWCLFVVADHALQRLFYRLKSLSDHAVLTELAMATRGVCAWYPILTAFIEDDMSIGLPTPKGMLIMKRVPTTAPFSPCGFLATTWVNDALIGARKGQAEALDVARAQRGIVVQIGDHYLPLTPSSNLTRFVTHSHPYTNVFYAEMLRHLPLASPLNSQVNKPR
jgi:hypothetical protein